MLLREVETMCTTRDVLNLALQIPELLQRHDDLVLGSAITVGQVDVPAIADRHNTLPDEVITKLGEQG
jgi:hypothetical protein